MIMKKIIIVSSIIVSIFVVFVVFVFKEYFVGEFIKINDMEIVVVYL